MEKIIIKNNKESNYAVNMSLVSYLMNEMMQTAKSRNLPVDGLMVFEKKLAWYKGNKQVELVPDFINDYGFCTKRRLLYELEPRYGWSGAFAKLTDSGVTVTVDIDNGSEPDSLKMSYRLREAV